MAVSQKSKEKEMKLMAEMKKKAYKFNELQYAKNIFKANPIRRNELQYYAGWGKVKRNPHGIPDRIWRKAYKWAKETGNLDID